MQSRFLENQPWLEANCHTKHAKGPWVVDTTSHHGGLCIKPMPGQVVADVLYSQTPEDWAVARMLAAAPKALTACESLVAWWEASKSNAGLLLHEAVTMATEAMADALGDEVQPRLTVDAQSHAQNAIEITHGFMIDEGWEDFATTVRNRNGGQMGLYDLIEAMARVVTDWEITHPDWWDDAPCDWTEVCESFCTKVMAYVQTSLSIPGQPELDLMFNLAVKGA